MTIHIPTSKPGPTRTELPPDVTTTPTAAAPTKAQEKTKAADTFETTQHESTPTPSLLAPPRPGQRAQTTEPVRLSARLAQPTWLSTATSYDTLDDLARRYARALHAGDANAASLQVELSQALRAVRDEGAAARAVLANVDADLLALGDALSSIVEEETNELQLQAAVEHLHSRSDLRFKSISAALTDPKRRLSHAVAKLGLRTEEVERYIVHGETSPQLATLLAKRAEAKQDDPLWHVFEQMTIARADLLQVRAEQTTDPAEQEALQRECRKLRAAYRDGRQNAELRQYAFHERALAKAESPEAASEHKEALAALDEKRHLRIEARYEEAVKKLADTKQPTTAQRTRAQDAILAVFDLRLAQGGSVEPIATAPPMVALPKDAPLAALLKQAESAGGTTVETKRRNLRVMHQRAVGSPARQEDNLALEKGADELIAATLRAPIESPDRDVALYTELAMMRDGARLRMADTLCAPALTHTELAVAEQAAHDLERLLVAKREASEQFQRSGLFAFGDAKRANEAQLTQLNAEIVELKTAIVDAKAHEASTAALLKSETAAAQRLAHEPRLTGLSLVESIVSSHASERAKLVQNLRDAGMEDSQINSLALQIAEAHAPQAARALETIDAVAGSQRTLLVLKGREQDRLASVKESIQTELLSLTGQKEAAERRGKSMQQMIDLDAAKTGIETLSFHAAEIDRFLAKGEVSTKEQAATVRGLEARVDTMRAGLAASLEADEASCDQTLVGADAALTHARFNDLRFALSSAAASRADTGYAYDYLRDAKAASEEALRMAGTLAEGTDPQGALIALSEATTLRLPFATNIAMQASLSASVLHEASRDEWARGMNALVALGHDALASASKLQKQLGDPEGASYKAALVTNTKAFVRMKALQNDLSSQLKARAATLEQTRATITTRWAELEKEHGAAAEQVVWKSAELASQLFLSVGLRDQLASSTGFAKTAEYLQQSLREEAEAIETQARALAGNEDWGTAYDLFHQDGLYDARADLGTFVASLSRPQHALAALRLLESEHQHTMAVIHGASQHGGIMALSITNEVAWQMLGSRALSSGLSALGNAWRPTRTLLQRGGRLWDRADEALAARNAGGLLTLSSGLGRLVVGRYATEYAQSALKEAGIKQNDWRSKAVLYLVSVSTSTNVSQAGRSAAANVTAKSVILDVAEETNWELGPALVSRFVVQLPEDMGDVAETFAAAWKHRRSVITQNAASTYFSPEQRALAEAAAFVPALELPKGATPEIATQALAAWSTSMIAHMAPALGHKAAAAQVETYLGGMRKHISGPSPHAFIADALSTNEASDELPTALHDFGLPETMRALLITASTISRYGDARVGDSLLKPYELRRAAQAVLSLPSEQHAQLEAMLAKQSSPRAQALLFQALAAQADQSGTLGDKALRKLFSAPGTLVELSDALAATRNDAEISALISVSPSVAEPDGSYSGGLVQSFVNSCGPVTRRIIEAMHDPALALRLKRSARAQADKEASALMNANALNAAQPSEPDANTNRQMQLYGGVLVTLIERGALSNEVQDTLRHLQGSQLSQEKILATPRFAAAIETALNALRTHAELEVTLEQLTHALTHSTLSHTFDGQPLSDVGLDTHADFFAKPGLRTQVMGKDALGDGRALRESLRHFGPSPVVLRWGGAHDAGHIFYVEYDAARDTLVFCEVNERTAGKGGYGVAVPMTEFLADPDSALSTRVFGGRRAHLDAIVLYEAADATSHVRQGALSDAANAAVLDAPSIEEAMHIAERGGDGAVAVLLSMLGSPAAAVKSTLNAVMDGASALKPLAQTLLEADTVRGGAPWRTNAVLNHDDASSLDLVTAFAALKAKLGNTSDWQRFKALYDSSTISIEQKTWLISAYDASPSTGALLADLLEQRPALSAKELASPERIERLLRDAGHKEAPWHRRLFAGLLGAPTISPKTLAEALVTLHNLAPLEQSTVAIALAKAKTPREQHLLLRLVAERAGVLTSANPAAREAAAQALTFAAEMLASSDFTPSEIMRFFSGVAREQAHPMVGRLLRMPDSYDRLVAIKTSLTKPTLSERLWHAYRACVDATSLWRAGSTKPETRRIRGAGVAYEAAVEEDNVFITGAMAAHTVALGLQAVWERHYKDRAPQSRRAPVGHLFMRLGHALVNGELALRISDLASNIHGAAPVARFSYDWLTRQQGDTTLTLIRQEALEPVRGALGVSNDVFRFTDAAGLTYYVKPVNERNRLDARSEIWVSVLTEALGISYAPTTRAVRIRMSDGSIVVGSAQLAVPPSYESGATFGFERALGDPRFASTLATQQILNYVISNGSDRNHGNVWFNERTGHILNSDNAQAGMMAIDLHVGGGKRFANELPTTLSAPDRELLLRLCDQTFLEGAVGAHLSVDERKLITIRAEALLSHLDYEATRAARARPSESGAVPRNEAQTNTLPINEGTLPINEGTLPIDEGTLPIDEGTLPIDEDTIQEPNAHDQAAPAPHDFAVALPKDRQELLAEIDPLGPVVEPTSVAALLNERLRTMRIADPQWAKTIAHLQARIEAAPGDPKRERGPALLRLLEATDTFDRVTVCELARRYGVGIADLPHVFPELSAEARAALASLTPEAQDLLMRAHAALHGDPIALAPVRADIAAYVAGALGADTFVTRLSALCTEGGKLRQTRALAMFELLNQHLRPETRVWHHPHTGMIVFQHAGAFVVLDEAQHTVRALSEAELADFGQDLKAESSTSAGGAAPAVILRQLQALQTAYALLGVPSQIATNRQRSIHRLVFTPSERTAIGILAMTAHEQATEVDFNPNWFFSKPDAGAMFDPGRRERLPAISVSREDAVALTISTVARHEMDHLLLFLRQFSSAHGLDATKTNLARVLGTWLSTAAQRLPGFARDSLYSKGHAAEELHTYSRDENEIWGPALRALDQLSQSALAPGPLGAETLQGVSAWLRWISTYPPSRHGREIARAQLELSAAFHRNLSQTPFFVQQDAHLAIGSMTLKIQNGNLVIRDGDHSVVVQLPLGAWSNTEASLREVYATVAVPHMQALADLAQKYMSGFSEVDALLAQLGTLNGSLNVTASPARQREILAQVQKVSARIGTLYGALSELGSTGVAPEAQHKHDTEGIALGALHARIVDPSRVIAQLNDVAPEARSLHAARLYSRRLEQIDAAQLTPIEQDKYTWRAPDGTRHIVTLYATPDALVRRLHVLRGLEVLGMGESANHSLAQLSDRPGTYAIITPQTEATNAAPHHSVIRAGIELTKRALELELRFVGDGVEHAPGGPAELPDQLMREVIPRWTKHKGGAQLGRPIASAHGTLEGLSEARQTLAKSLFAGQAGDETLSLTVFEHPLDPGAVRLVLTRIKSSGDFEIETFSIDQNDTLTREQHEHFTQLERTRSTLSDAAGWDLRLLELSAHEEADVRTLADLIRAAPEALREAWTDALYRSRDTFARRPALATFFFQRISGGDAANKHTEVIDRMNTLVEAAPAQAAASAKRMLPPKLRTPRPDEWRVLPPHLAASGNGAWHEVPHPYTKGKTLWARRFDRTTTAEQCERYTLLAAELAKAGLHPPVVGTIQLQDGSIAYAIEPLEDTRDAVPPSAFSVDRALITLANAVSELGYGHDASYWLVPKHQAMAPVVIDVAALSPGGVSSPIDVLIEHQLRTHGSLLTKLPATERLDAAAARMALSQNPAVKALPRPQRKSTLDALTHFDENTLRGLWVIQGTDAESRVWVLALQRSANGFTWKSVVVRPNGEQSDVVIRDYDPDGKLAAASANKTFSNDAGLVQNQLALPPDILLAEGGTIARLLTAFKNGGTKPSDLSAAMTEILGLQTAKPKEAGPAGAYDHVTEVRQSINTLRNVLSEVGKELAPLAVSRRMTQVERAALVQKNALVLDYVSATLLHVRRLLAPFSREATSAALVQALDECTAILAVRYEEAIAGLEGRRP